MDGSLSVNSADRSATARQVASAHGYPIFGVLPTLRKDPLGFLAKAANAQGDLIDLNLGFDRVLMVNDAEVIKHMSAQNWRNYRKSEFYRPLKPILGHGIFLAEGDTWISQRRIAGAGFQGNDLRSILHKMCTATADMIERWRLHAKTGRPIDVAHEMAHLTLDIVLQCLFNVQLEDQDQDVYGALTCLLRDAERKVWSPISMPGWVPTRNNLACNEALRSLDKFVQSIIEDRRRNPEKPNDLLQVFVDAYGENPDIAPNLLRDEVLSMILAGHETTANALAWAWYLLANNPHIARELGDSSLSTVGHRTIEFGDVAELRFAKMVFDETVRLYPPVWTLSRTAIADDRYEDLEITAGTKVMMCAYAVHRYKRYWTDPEGFDPYRFDPRHPNGVPHHAYFPFGVGVRSCLGARFGLMEAIIILTMVSRVFRLSLEPGQRIVPEPMITLRPGGPILMDLHRL